MSKKWITDGIDNNGWTWIAAEKGDTRGLILNAADADRVVCLLRAMDGIDDPEGVIAAVRRSLADAISDDPMPDWRDSLADAWDALCGAGEGSK